MPPHMKAINSILCLAVATHCWAEDNSYNKDSVFTPEIPCVQISVSSENEHVSRLVNLGLQDVLFGYTERASQYFTQALTLDSDCVLAHACMLVVTPAGSDTYRHHLQELNQLMTASMLNPVEEWYLSTLLQYVSGDLSGAATAFKERAARYRRDTMAACWDIVLNHYARTETAASLINRADKLTASHPENGLVHMCRALTEEYSASPSEKGLRSAQKATELLPENPVAHMLRGRLLALAAAPDKALQQFELAARYSIPSSELHLTARLSQINARIQSGDKKLWIEALQEARKLAQESTDDTPTTDAGILLYWEGRSMLLRMLVLQETPPASQAINMASRTCNAQENTPLEMMQSCLVEAIRARSLAQTDRKSTAARCLANAEKHLQRLQRAGDLSSSMLRLCHQRALQACTGAILRAKIALYSTTADIWKEQLAELLASPTSRLLPPPLPHSLSH